MDLEKLKVKSNIIQNKVQGEVPIFKKIGSLF